MNNTTNIPYTALKTAVHRIIQQQPTNMQQLENIVDGVEDQYGVPISLDNVNLTVEEVSLDDLAIDQDTLDECSEILWLCDSAGHPTSNSNTRGNHKNVIGQDVLHQASETISACLHLYQMLEDTIDSNES
ncbi:hypothetical protein COH17_00115 [Staphylococcus epidermidis]|uniref:hypothetical protein n=1 Tax=Staphylococcus epidermidis TaxID=1282 RepID=UPI000E24D1E6|nr:hypothetical protein [Staphylococcus epidermidis]REB26554.1 hypothetical protein COH17_00115 [Staphylococcus epidermidis]